MCKRGGEERRDTEREGGKGKRERDRERGGIVREKGREKWRERVRGRKKNR